MNAIHKGIMAIKDLISILPPSLLVAPGETGKKIKSAHEAIQALQSLDGEAVDDPVYKLSELMRGLEIPPEAVAGNNPGFFYLIGKHIAEQAKAGAKPLPPAVPDGYVPVQIELVAFLKGIGTLNGMSFGEYPEPSEGDFTRKFWWRKYLPEIPLDNDEPSGSSCDIECGAYGTLCKCNAEAAAQPASSDDEEGHYQ